MVPSVPTITSRAASEVIRPMPIFQLNPSGLMTGSIGFADHPGEAVLDLGRLAVVQRQVRQHPKHDGHRKNHGSGPAQKYLRRGRYSRKPSDRKVGQR